MYIQDVYARLVESARERIRAGELSERGLARLCDLSQPHMHHVLKNVRALSPASADRLMRALDLTLTDLLWRYPGEAETGVRAIPILRTRLGPGGDLSFTSFRGYAPFPLSLTKTLISPIAARLAPDLVMPAGLRPNDLVLLDQNPTVRQNPGGRAMWAVAKKGGIRVRYVKTGGSLIYLASEATLREPSKWQSVTLQGRNILDVVRARIVWIGREMETEPAGPADPAGGRN